MTRNTATLNELIEVLNDGIRFYEEAAEATDNAGYRTLFLRLATAKRALTQELARQVAGSGGTPAQGGTLAGTLRKGYAELSAKLSRHPDAKYIGQLEETEDRILEAFQSALAEGEDAQVRQAARNYLPQVRAMHDEMRTLKRETPDAA